MAINRETVLHVARLARLELRDDEATRMEQDLGNILEYVATLTELDTSNVAETAHLAVEAAPLRPDEQRPGVPTELALGEAPRTAGGAFAVPGFVED